MPQLICGECTAREPRGIAYTKDWIVLSYGMGPGVAKIEFCSWECVHRYTVGNVIGEGYMLGTRA